MVIISVAFINVSRDMLIILFPPPSCIADFQFSVSVLLTCLTPIAVEIVFLSSVEVEIHKNQ